MRGFGLRENTWWLRRRRLRVVVLVDMANVSLQPTACCNVREVEEPRLGPPRQCSSGAPRQRSTPSATNCSQLRKDSTEPSRRPRGAASHVARYGDHSQAAGATNQANYEAAARSSALATTTPRAFHALPAACFALTSLHAASLASCAGGCSSSLTQPPCQRPPAICWCLGPAETIWTRFLNCFGPCGKHLPWGDPPPGVQTGSLTRGPKRSISDITLVSNLHPNRFCRGGPHEGPEPAIKNRFATRSKKWPSRCGWFQACLWFRV